MKKNTYIILNNNKNIDNLDVNLINMILLFKTITQNKKFPEVNKNKESI